MTNAEQRERALRSFCDNCEAECKRLGCVPFCYGQYGNPCTDYLDEEERLEKEVQDNDER